MCPNGEIETVESMSEKMRRRRRVAPKPTDAEPSEIGKAEAFDPTFEAREGDRLVVSYAGAKVAFEGTYSSVECPGGTYSRTLLEGDDPAVEYERIYAFLKGRSEKHAREKLTWFSDQVKKANARARGNR